MKFLFLIIPHVIPLYPQVYDFFLQALFVFRGNKIIKIIYWFYHLYQFNKKIQNFAHKDQLILKISECISMYYFLHTKLNFLLKYVCYLLVNNVLKSLLSTCFKESVPYLLKHLSFSNLANATLSNAVGHNLPLEIQIKNNSIVWVDFKEKATTSVAIIAPQKRYSTNVQKNIYLWPVNFFVRKFLIYLLDHYLIKTSVQPGILLRFARKAILITIVVSIPSFNTVISYIIIVINNSQLRAPFKAFLVSLKDKYEICIRLLINSVTVLGSSFNVIAKHHPCIKSAINFLTEPSEINWVSLIETLDQNIYTYTNNSVTVLGAIFNVIAKQYTPNLELDTSLIGELITSFYFKKVSLICVDTAIQISSQNPIQTLSGFMFNKLYQNLNEDHEF